MSSESKVVFARDGALGTVTLQSPPLIDVADGIAGADALLLEVAVGLFDTEDARAGIKSFLESGAADAAFTGR